MKKFLVVLAALAMVGLSSMAFAADLAVSGSLEIRSRDFQSLTGVKGTGDQVDTQERVRLNVDAKASDALKGRISIENDWDTWGRLETPMANGNGLTAANNGGAAGPNDSFLDLREAWIDFMVPDLPVGVKAGHQLLQLGSGWFLRNMKYGDDAWLVYVPTGNNLFAAANIKVAEGGNIGTAAAPVYSENVPDVDAYAGLDQYKIDDKNSVGIYLADVNFRSAGGNTLQDLGVYYLGALGALNLKGELDVQMGKDNATDAKYSGNQIVLEGNVPVSSLTVNATVAMGSGRKSSDADVKNIVTFLDADPHYTFLYEYKVKGAGGGVHQGFDNTTALNVGASMPFSKSVNGALNLWVLQATQKTNINGGTESSDAGMELDAKIGWKLYDNLSWNWSLGYFKPGDMYKSAAGKGTDAITGIQGILGYNF